MTSSLATRGQADPDTPLYRGLMRYRIKQRSMALVADGTWEEDQHPRDEHGKFESTGGSEKASSDRGPVGSELPNLTPGSFEQMDEDTGRALLEADMHGSGMKADEMGPIAKQQVMASLADSTEGKITAAMIGSVVWPNNSDLTVAAQFVAAKDSNAAIAVGGSGSMWSNTSPDDVIDPNGGSGAGGLNWMRADDPRAEEAIRQGFAAYAVNNWAASSNDSNPTSLFMQECARQEFGLGGTKDWPILNGDTASRVNDMLNNKDAVDAGRALLRAQYDNTQGYLQAAGIDRLALARGSMYNEDSAPAWVTSTDRYVDVPARPMSSWSTDIDTVSNFADKDSLGGDIGVVQYASVPREAILSCPRTGYGCLEESEFVVLHTGGSSLIERE